MLFFHGTWLSRLAHFGDAPDAAGIRLLYVDRPGYGASDAHDERTLLGWAADVEALADSLGLDEFGVVGCSGGGSHALACAAALRGRVRAGAIVSGVGPARDLPAVAAVLPPARRGQVELARTDPEAAWASVLAEATEGIEELSADTDPVPDVDDVRLRARLDAALRETARRGASGPATDLALNYLRPWGFDLADVAVPVAVWHAENDDTVPVGVATAVIDRLPAPVPKLTPAGGHLLAWTRARDILAELGEALLQHRASAPIH